VLIVQAPHACRFPAAAPRTSRAVPGDQGSARAPRHLPPSLCADARTSPHLSRLGDRTADRAQLWRVASRHLFARSNLRPGIGTLPPQAGVYVPRRLSRSAVSDGRSELSSILGVTYSESDFGTNGA